MNRSRGIEVRTTERSGGVVLPRSWTESSELDAYDFRLACWLSTHTDEYRERLSQVGIARRLNMSQDRVSKSLDNLQRLGLVKVEGGGSTRPVSVTFFMAEWEAPLPATREATSRHTGSDFPPHGTQENTERNTESPNARARIEEGFNEFWRVYPKKRAKVAALKAYERAVMGAAKGSRHIRVAEIQQAAERYALERAGQDDKYTKYPAGWLNDGQWEDQPVAIARRQSDHERLLAEYNGIKYV